MILSSTKQKTNELDQSLEYFVFINVIFMILVHYLSIYFTYKLGYLKYPNSDYLFFTVRILGFFNICIPASAAFSYARQFQLSEHTTKSYIDGLRSSFKVLIYLFFIEYLLDHILMYPNIRLTEYSFGVLHFTGLSLFLLSLLSPLPKIIHVLLIPLILFVEYYFSNDMRSLGLYVLSGADTYEYQWSLFPWFSVPLAGYTIGSYWHTLRSKKIWKQKNDFWVALTSSFVVLILIYNFGLNFELDYSKRWGDAIYHPTINIIIINLLIIPLVLALASIYSRYKLIKRNSIVDIFNKRILGIYVFHIVFIRFFLIPNIRPPSTVKDIISNGVLSSPYILSAIIVGFLITLFLSFHIFKLIQKYFHDINFIFLPRDQK